MAEASLEHQFNGDLLVSKHDQDLAKKLYGEIYHVLDHPELRREFQAYDVVANSSKLWVQRVGLLAVLLAAIALLGSAISPLVHQFHDISPIVQDVLFWLEVAGIVGVTIAAGGIALAKQKRRWLKARMMAEVIRLWHFQSLICRGKEIAMSCDPSNKKASANYRVSRATAFQAMLNDWGGSPDSHLSELIEKPAEGYEMLHDQESHYPAGSAVIDKIFAAYKATRFKHQANYAAHKLERSTDYPLRILKWPAAVLQERMQLFASMCLVLSLVCSLLTVIGHVAKWEISSGPILPVATIVLLILNVAARAVQDGLAAPEELQRYNDYAGKIEYLRRRFDVEHSPEEKIKLMVEMERAALEELKGFLRAHFESRFIV
jgi:hypothetical protein